MVAHILKTKSITVYLSQKGIEPIKRAPGKLFYSCPLPDHNETKPSFVVFTNGPFENFHCFGCQARYHIVHLVSRMEGISFKESLSRLSDGVEITTQDEFDYEADEIIKAAQKDPLMLETSSSALLLASYCRSYLESVGYDDEQVGIIDKFWSGVDQSILEYEFDAMPELPELVREKLRKKRERFEIKKREQIRKKYESGESD